MNAFCKFCHRAAGIFLATTFILTISTSHAAIPPAENLLPADTLFLFTIPDCSALRADAHQSPQWLLWSDPAMKPFRDHFMAKWNEQFIAPLEKDLGVKLDDYLPLFQGQFDIAVTQNGWNGAGDAVPGLVLLLDAKDKSALLTTNLTALKKKWTEEGKPLQTKIFHGVPFSVVTLSSNDIPAPLAAIFPHQPPVQDSDKDNNPQPSGKIFIGQFQSLLIAGNSENAVATVAARLTGGSNPALSGNALFAADQLSQFHNTPLYYSWFNAKTFFNTLAKIPAPDDGASSFASRMPWDKILSASGLTGLKTVSLTYRESHDGAQVEFYVSAPEADRQGLIKMIAAAPKDANPPAFVPADAVKFWRWRVDGQKSWAELEKMLTAISPAALSSLNSILDMANATAQRQDPSFDIRKSLISNLGDDWIRFEKAPDGKTLGDLNAAPSLFLFAANNPDQAILAVKNIAALSSGGEAPKPRDFLGRKIYTIPLPARRMPGATTAPASRSLYCAASGGYIAITTDVSMIENYLRSSSGKTKSLSETPGLIAAAQHVGGAGNGLFGYQNQRESVRTLFAALKSDPAAASSALSPLAHLPFGSSGMDIQDWMDFSLLPDYDKVAKYFSFTVYGGSATSDGLDFKFFTPRPPQLN
jgi:hypothetical protein